MSLNNSEIEEKLNSKELQNILENIFHGKVHVLNLKATKFLPVGENYCSAMIKLDVTICLNDSLDEEKLYLVAKTMDKSEIQILDWTKAFEKEVYVYSQLVPAYRDLERKMGVEESNLLDVLPKYYGHRYTLEDDNFEAGQYSMFLMENLKEQGFYSGNRRSG